jgi:hypothetical protein
MVLASLFSSLLKFNQAGMDYFEIILGGQLILFFLKAKR